MNRLLIVLLSLAGLLCWLGAQNVKTVDGVAIANVKTVDGVAIASVKSIAGVDNTSAGGGGGPSYLVSEDAEGTGTPSGWFSNGADVNWDETSVVLAGSQSLKCDGTTNLASVAKSVSGQTDVWVYFIFRFNTTPTTFRRVFTWYDEEFTELMALMVTTGGDVILNTGGGEDVPDLSLTADTNYHVWLHYVAGTGGDGSATLYLSTDATRPGSPTVSVVNALATSATHEAVWRAEAGSGIFYYDTIRVDDEEIGSNPP